MALRIEEALALGAVGVWVSSLAVGKLEPWTRQRRKSPALGGFSLVAAEPNGLHECRRIAWRYLPVYALGTLGDWMQGGHLYALYQSYDYSIAHIAHIFAIGYTSAALLGTYAAAFGDRYGYRLCVIIYGVCYSLECLSMNYASTSILLAGRICGGIAYSLLYVSFESWLVAEGQARALPSEYMGHLFATATTVNALSAVLGGALAHTTLEMGREAAEEARRNIYASPFNAATVPLLGCSLLAALAWKERYSHERRGARHALRNGDSKTGEEEERLFLPGSVGESDGAGSGGSGCSDAEAPPFNGAGAAPTAGNGAGGERAKGGHDGEDSGSVTASLLGSLRRLRREPTLLQLGLLSSLYEATLYAFVFLWTPALESRAASAGGLNSDAQIAHGKIFSLLMLFKAAGSRVFATGLGRVAGDAMAGAAGVGGTHRSFALRALKLTFSVSAACLLVPVFSVRYDTTLCAFCAFEMTLGFYWPAVAMLRTEFVVEGRSSMMSVFRVLLNVLVILLLELSGLLSESAMFLIACAMLVASWISVSLLQARVTGTAPLLGLPGATKASRSDDLNAEDDLDADEARAMLRDEGVQNV